METRTSSQIEEYKEAFDVFDRDGDGVIETKDLGFVLKALGIRLTKAELNEMIEEVDEDGNGTIDFQEFLSMISRKLKETNLLMDIMNAFKVFDRDGEGYVRTAELGHILTDMGEKLKKSDVEVLLDECDADGDGNIDWEEFLRAVLSPKKG